MDYSSSDNATGTTADYNNIPTTPIPTTEIITVTDRKPTTTSYISEISPRSTEAYIDLLNTIPFEEKPTNSTTESTETEISVSEFECGPRLMLSGFRSEYAHLNGIWTLAMEDGKLLTSGCLTVEGTGINY